MAKPRYVIPIALLAFAAFFAFALVLPHLINALAPSEGGGERVPTFSKLMSGLGIVEDTEVEELTLSQMEEIEAIKADIQDSLGLKQSDERADTAAIDLGVDIHDTGQFNNISTGDFLMDEPGTEDSQLLKDLEGFDLQEP